MKHPDCYEDPFMVQDDGVYLYVARPPPFVWYSHLTLPLPFPHSCGAATDNGGVHWNSGVPNAVYSTFADGTNWFSQPITAAGLIPAINIFVRGMGSLTAQSTFPNFASIMNDACTDLIGQTLKDPLTNSDTSETVTADTCTTLSSLFTNSKMTDTAPCANAVSNPNTRTELSTSMSLFCFSLMTECSPLEFSLLYSLLGKPINYG